MKKLLLIIALGLFLGFPLVSHAGVFGVKTPVVKKEVSGNLAGGYYIANDNSLNNTLVPQKLNNSISTPNRKEAKESFYVFGVDIKSLNLI